MQGWDENMAIMNDDDATKLVFEGWNAYHRKFVKMLAEYDAAPDRETKRKIAKSFLERVDIPAWVAVKDAIMATFGPQLQDLDKMAREINRNLVDKMPIS
jgi:hypothetical protein